MDLGLKISYLHIFCFFISFSISANEDSSLRIFSWDGYVTNNDLTSLNEIYKSNDLKLNAKLITPYAEGHEQMFNVIRDKQCDISFLTLFFIKLNNQKITKLLSPINTSSKRFTNYKHLLPSATNLAMGKVKNKTLYIPYGGGVYGFYVNMNKVKKKDIPRSINDLWLPKWKGKFSLNKTQVWYNVGISLMALGLPPFHLNDLVLQNKRKELMRLRRNDGEIQFKVNELYQNAESFWTSGTKFNDKLSIVSSWGPEIKLRNQKYGENWKKINFKEGDVVWLDTINFMKDLSEEKLIAAELTANYFIGKEAQQRVVSKLSMISVSKQSSKNKMIIENSDVFNSKRMVPPYSKASGMLMQSISDQAMKQRKNEL